MKKLRRSSAPRLYQAFDFIIDQDQREHTACFTGHRHLSDEELSLLPELLDHELSNAADRGIINFWSGCALGFDLIAAEAVLRLRCKRPEVNLRLAVPCADQASGWPDYEKQRRDRLIYAADEIAILADTYYDGCMLVRNRFMVDRSALVFAWLRHMRGGTLSTAAYALRCGLTVHNLAMKTENGSNPD